MNPKVILSSNLNPEYLFYAPITAWCWRQFGFTPIMLYVGDNKTEHYNDLLKLVIDYQQKYAPHSKDKIYWNASIIRTVTVTQAIRLYGFMAANKGDYVMIGDIDMIPLDSFLYRDFDKVNVFGHDLTDYTQIPMCYVGMYKEKWEEIIKTPDWNISGMEKIFPSCYFALNQHANTFSNDFDKFWYIDQDILTKSLEQYGLDKINFHKRGKEHNGFASRRVDRGNWNWDSGEYRDAHLPKNPLENFGSVYRLIREKIHGDSSWMPEYAEAFKNQLIQK